MWGVTIPYGETDYESKTLPFLSLFLSFNLNSLDTAKRSIFILWVTRQGHETLYNYSSEFGSHMQLMRKEILAQINKLEFRIFILLKSLWNHWDITQVCSVHTIYCLRYCHN